MDQDDILSLHNSRHARQATHDGWLVGGKYPSPSIITYVALSDDEIINMLKVTSTLST